MGTWDMGGGTRADFDRDRETIEIIQTAIQLGFTHIDTTEIYGNGHAEELVGQAIKAFERQHLFITTKVAPPHLKYQDVWIALEGSLKRLGTDCVDLYLIHWLNRQIPLEETFRALNEAVERRLIHYLGVSNFDIEHLKRSQSLSATPIVTNQVSYSLKDRSFDSNGALRYYQDIGCLLTAYSPLKGGVLSDGVVRSIARKYEATPAQIALSWLIRQPKVITIPKSAKTKRLQENLGALDLHLTEEDVDKLDKLSGV